MISHEYVSLVAILLANVLPKIGVVLGNEEITTTITAIVTIVGALWAMFRRWRKGDITVAGFKKLG